MRIVDSKDQERTNEADVGRESGSNAIPREKIQGKS